jgi:hypothetical protein
VVRIAERRFAIPADTVRAVLPARSPTALPLAKPALAGITLFRGRVLPLVLPEELVGTDPAGAGRGSVVVIDLSGGFGLVVSEVLGMTDQEGSGEIRWNRRQVEPMEPAELLRGGLVVEGSEGELKPNTCGADQNLEAEPALQTAASPSGVDGDQSC